jgi:hypothetical protein
MLLFKRFYVQQGPGMVYGVWRMAYDESPLLLTLPPSLAPPHSPPPHSLLLLRQVCCTTGCKTDPKSCTYSKTGCSGTYGKKHGCVWATDECLVG